MLFIGKYLVTRNIVLTLRDHWPSAKNFTSSAQCYCTMLLAKGQLRNK